MLRIGVIGLGSMGKNHARVCSEIENIELVGVSDIDQENVNKISNKFGTLGFTNYKELIPKIDLAIVATPTSNHFEIANNLLDAGKHILIEKPICDTVEKSASLVKKAESEGVVCAVGHIEKHNPAVKFVKESLDKGDFGDLITITSKRVSNFPGRIKDVGVILDFGVHDIDVMRLLAGEIKSVYAKAGRYIPGIVHEDHANIVLNFENNICGVMEINWLTPVKIRKLFLTCSNNFIEADYIDQSVAISTSTFSNINEMDLYHSSVDHNVNFVSLEKKEPLRNEIEDFIKAVKENKKPLATGRDGLITLKVCEAATQSYKTGEEVKIV